MDRWQAMEAFVRVVDAEGFAEAARRWGRSKAVVSKYVAQLEAHLGVRLLQRTTRSISLTDAGRQHVAQCRHILSDLEAAEARLRDDSLAPSGTLRVSAPPGLLTLHPDLIGSFVRHHPKVQLDLDLTHRMVDLVEERIDVALRVTRPQDSSLVARRIAPAPLILVASPAYVSAHGAPSCPEELRAHPCIMDTNFRFHPRWPMRWDGRTLSIAVRGPVQVNSPLMVRALACADLGIGLVPEFVVARALREGRLQEVLPGCVAVEWSVFAVTSQRRWLPARVRAFLTHLGDSLAGPADRAPTPDGSP